MKSKNLEMFLAKEKKDKYPEEINNDYKLSNYNNRFNSSNNNDLENTIISKNKKYIDNATTRMNTNNKVVVINNRKIKPYDDNIFTNIHQEIGLKKNLQKITSKKVAFIGMTEKRSKLIFNDNKNLFLINNNNKDKKFNLKPLNEIKEIHNQRKNNKINQYNLIKNKNFSSLEIRPKNKILSQNVSHMNNNSLEDGQKNLSDNKLILNEDKEYRNQSSNLKFNEIQNNEKNTKTKENLIIKHKKKSQKDVIESNNILNNNNNNTTDSKEKFKYLSQKEKAFFILSQSKLLKLKERIIFSKATKNLHSLIPINEIINSNQIFIKEKINELKLKLIDYTKKIEKPFSPSKTADISLNIIKKGDEDIFKDFLESYTNLDEN